MNSGLWLESAPSFKRLYTQAVAAPLLPGGDAELPARRLVLRGAELERNRVADYAHVCGFVLRNDVPGTYPHVLAFPLHLDLMTDRSFPFSVLGLVHIANRIEVAAPIPVGMQAYFSYVNSQRVKGKRGVFGRHLPMVFLKQFRDCVDPTAACYQAIIEADATVTEFNELGFLPPGWTPDAPAPMPLRS